MDEIEKSFLDQSMDASLGRVRAPEPLPRQVDLLNW